MANTLNIDGYYGAGPSWTQIASDDKLYFQKSGAYSYGTGGAITVGEYNGGTHFISNADADVCTTNHQPNVEWSSDATHCKINGGSEVLLNTLAITDCFRFHGNCSPNAAVTASEFYLYDGATPANPIAGATQYGVEQGDASWANIGGSGNSYDLSTSASAADHYRYVAVTVSPSSNGAKSGKIYGAMTFV